MRVSRGNVLSALTAASLALAGGTVLAQTGRSTCQNVGVGSNEAFGDRAGHSMSASEYTCTNAGGPMDGSVSTGNGYWDVNGGVWSLLSGGGAIRGPGAFAVYQQLEGKMTTVMKDGKPAGLTGSGRYRVQAASGAWSALAGRTARWTLNATVPGRFTVDSTFE